ncbi:YceI family protein [Geminicoccus roseus]|uniref:YceI family protein n=1 Tax=Geminicoccus roseus TaxID=404900 RepID=UPI00041E964B|nr:YceI family protein [Geminicoccus roseus]
MMSRIGAAALAALAWALPAAAADWTVDPARSTLAVTVHQGQTPIQARFERFDAEISFDPADLEAAQVVVAVDLASFTSGDAQRDQQATGPDFLDAAGAAQAEYRTTSIEAMGGDQYEVEAELTLRGITRQLRHRATIVVNGGSAHATGMVPLIRTEFGVGSGQFATGSLVGLEVEVAFDLWAEAQ